MNKNHCKSIEVFTTGCYLCEETLGIVKAAKCEDCKIIERNISEECGCGCVSKSKEYGIRTIPTIVIDGKIALEGKPTSEEVKKVLRHTSS
jgi:hypothetical protein